VDGDAFANAGSRRRLQPRHQRLSAGHEPVIVSLRGRCCGRALLLPKDQVARLSQRWVAVPVYLTLTDAVTTLLLGYFGG
jgi:hypothetical protein